MWFQVGLLTHPVPFFPTCAMLVFGVGGIFTIHASYCLAVGGPSGWTSEPGVTSHYAVLSFSDLLSDGALVPLEFVVAIRRRS